MTDNSSECITAQFRFGGPPSVPTIRSTRTFFDQFCAPLVGPEASSRVGMVAHELLENLAKYSDGGPVELGVEVIPTEDHFRVRITTVNRTPRVSEVERALGDVSSSRDPEAQYVEYIRSAVARAEGSGLGLVRIRAEGEMEIHYAVSGNQITICAEALLSRWKEQ
jgi:hypothetical protein